MTRVGAKPDEHMMTTLHAALRRIASAHTSSSHQRDHGNDGVIFHPQHVLHARSSPNTHSAPQVLNLTDCAVKQHDGGLRGKAAAVTVHEPAHVVCDATQFGYQLAHMDISTGADDDDVGAGRVQNAESAASTIAWKVCRTNWIKAPALQSHLP